MTKLQQTIIKSTNKKRYHIYIPENIVNYLNWEKGQELILTIINNQLTILDSPFQHNPEKIEW